MSWSASFVFGVSPGSRHSLGVSCEFRPNATSHVRQVTRSVFFFPSGKWWENWWEILNVSPWHNHFFPPKNTFSHHFPPICRSGGKKIIFSSGKPKKKLEALGNRKKNSHWEKKNTGRKGSESRPPPCLYRLNQLIIICDNFYLCMHCAFRLAG